MLKLSLVLIGVLAVSVSCLNTEELAPKLQAPSTVARPSLLGFPTADLSARSQQTDKPAAKMGFEKRPANFFMEGDHVSVDGFTIEKRLRKERADFYERRNDPRNWAEIEYVVVKEGKRVLAKFDAGLSHPLGSRASFALFPFLGGDSQQVFISEDIPRGGCQWVVSLSPRLRVIFDGQAFGVGREGFDLSAEDLDDDGVYEIIAPITDFYQLQDKLYVAAIPLPAIIFRYDQARQQYLPANPIFKNRIFAHLRQLPHFDDKDALKFEHRAVVLSNLLTYVYAGEQKRGWEAFEKDYKLDDKAEIRRRVKAILKDQPVYKFIYRR